MTYHIIRTAADLKALDPDTLLIDTMGDSYRAEEAIHESKALRIYVDDLPAIVIMDPDKVRAARKALGATDG